MDEISAGAELIDNPVSAAPGFIIANVHVLPGVPRIMPALFEGLASRLVGGPPMLSHTVACTICEGQVAAGLGAAQGRYPAVATGRYAVVGAVHYGSSLCILYDD